MCYEEIQITRKNQERANRMLKGVLASTLSSSSLKSNYICLPSLIDQDRAVIKNFSMRFGYLLSKEAASRTVVASSTTQTSINYAIRNIKHLITPPSLPLPKIALKVPPPQPKKKTSNNNNIKNTNGKRKLVYSSSSSDSSLSSSSSSDICYKMFKEEDFLLDLENNLEYRQHGDFDCFDNILENTLNWHAPVKTKIVRGNNKPHISKSLRKAIMVRSKL